MITQILKLICLLFFVTSIGYGQSSLISGSDKLQPSSVSQDTVSDFINLLNTLAANSDNGYFKHHCTSILNVLQSKELSAYESTFVKKMFVTFSDTNVQSNASILDSYKERKRPFIISWTSPTDSVVSLAWLLLPENWNPELEYPLYVTLHGLFTPYSNPVEYMERYLSPDLVVEKSFEDGYSLFPWGRGNIWYEGIGETDVWESITAAEKIIKVNPLRKYLMGHSMGGYGAWVIAQKSVETWAALGIHAGALWYNNTYVTSAAAEKLKNIPVFFVCGTQDGLLSVNQTAYQLLQSAGNTNLSFETFPGGHEALLENWQKMYEWVRNFSKGEQTGIHEDIQIPFRTALYPNYPNPFNPTTTIGFTLETSGFTKLKIYDAIGREVAELVNEKLKAGLYHEVQFDASTLSSGIYFTRLEFDGKQIMKKMLLIK